jgi:hypothetical protein
VFSTFAAADNLAWIWVAERNVVGGERQPASRAVGRLAAREPCR